VDIVFLFYAIQGTIVFFGLYQWMISLFGFAPYRFQIHPPRYRFAVLIAAHNEQKVIGNLIASILKSNYPRHLYDIFVVADNCTDATGSVAEQAGAMVYHRCHPDRGKGFAIQWGLEKIYAFGHYDAVCIFDADNLVHPDFLTHMNSELCQGKRIIQGYVESKNPYDTWVTAVFTIAFWLMHRLYQRARMHLGLSGALAGTGMCIATGVLKQIGWRATSLTEDMEFSALALLAGYPTHFSPPAVVYDEKATGFWQSVRQRLRWARGKFDVAFKVAPQLVWKLLQTRKLIYFDFLVLVLGPFVLVLSFLYILMLTLASYAGFALPLPVDLEPLISFWGVAQYGLSMAVLIADRRSWKAYLWSMLYPVFLYTWVPIVLWALLTYRNKQWSHTLHNRNISLEEVRKSA